jgi:serine/threonine-protein kinase RsbW
MVRVYIIQSDTEFSDCLRRILETEGFRVKCGLSVDDLTFDHADDEPVVAVVDLHDGAMVTTDHVKQLADSLQNKPILVTANYKTPEVACKALGVGAHDFLLKPYATREIVDRIHSLAGTKENGNGKSEIDAIAESIEFITSIDDILRITLDQLASNLHMTDCLIAMEGEDGFNVMASRGYQPDPVSLTLRPTTLALDCLMAACEDPLAISGEIAREFVDTLGILNHRPFPTIMPLVYPDADGTRVLMGFVMGHGALVLEENDILEMEHFLDQIASELHALTQTGERPHPHSEFRRQGEFNIPGISREDATNQLLEMARPYLAHENDLFWIRLALDEAINNAIIHGHSETLDKYETEFRIKYSIGPGRIIITIEDRGEGFDHRNLPDPTADENLLSINGRGIYIMRKVMDEVVFNERGNQVSLVKKLDGSPLSPSMNEEESTPELV